MGAGETSTTSNTCRLVLHPSTIGAVRLSRLNRLVFYQSGTPVGI